MADKFLRFLEGYIKAEKVKSDAIHGNFPSFASIFCIFEKNEKKKRKFCRSSTLKTFAFSTPSLLEFPLILCGGGIDIFWKCSFDFFFSFFMFLGYQASISSYNRSLVERSGVARALVEVSSDNNMHYLFLGKWCVGLSLWASISINCVTGNQEQS